MTSPFKFLDSYSKVDHSIFPDRDSKYPDFIPPLQGLKGMFIHYRIGRCPMLKVFRAYSATDPVRALNGQAYFKAGHRPAENLNMILTSPEGA